MGSAKQGRERNFQAILPLRGKILNVEKANMNKVLSNVEIQAMISAIGAGVGETFDVDQVRYNKIVIMTDADVDGSHIRTLVLTFLFRNMPELIEAGYVYIAQPPLYKVTHQRKDHYVYNDRELQETLTRLNANGNANIGRFKGLGEMNPIPALGDDDGPAEQDAACRSRSSRPRSRTSCSRRSWATR